MASKSPAKSSRKVPAASASRASSTTRAAPASRGASTTRASKKKVPAAAVAAPPPAPKPLTLEERVAALEERLQRAGEEFRKAYQDSLDISWIYHDAAIEGTVYTFPELKAAMDPDAAIVTDSSLQPICEEVRRHREALDFIRDYGVKKRLPITVELIKKIYLILHPDEGDIKTVKYRKDIPQHRLYFHEYAPPDKITYKVRQVIDWLNDPETKRTRGTVRIAARAHYDLLRVFPFATDSGKVARLFMNLLLLRGGLPPAIVHSTERQRYYDALKGASPAMTQLVQEAIDNNLASVEKLLDAHEATAYTAR